MPSRSVLRIQVKKRVLIIGGRIADLSGAKGLAHPRKSPSDLHALGWTAGPCATRENSAGLFAKSDPLPGSTRCFRCPKQAARQPAWSDLARAKSRENMLCGWDRSQFRRLQRACYDSGVDDAKHTGAPSVRMILDLALALHQGVFFA